MGYKFRGVKCPWCNHDFMWQENNGEGLKIYEYRLKETKELVEKCTCPKCNKSLIIIPKKYEGIDINDEKIEKIGIRGI